ncbi:MAG: anthranilate phosphoribosyltransferase [Rhodobacterales bacterium]|nr:anthranilate phosphoribosyltransferase [Rhodobacterales bacterium]
MRVLLELLLEGHDLTAEQGSVLMGGLTDPEVHPSVKGALLVALRIKGVTSAELLGMAKGMRASARPVAVAAEGAPLIDTCGTGGDGSDTINVSTATALVLAGCGLRVVKHGNRSISSKSGSADVMEALGISLPDGPKEAEDQLEKTGFTFLFAPHFHPAMKSVVPVRRAMKIRTAFNMLGPLTNPALPPHQVLGAFSLEACALMAHALSGLPIKRCKVVFGAPGWDEATPIGRFDCWEVTPGQVHHHQVDPLDNYGIPRCSASDLKGGDAVENAAALMAIFQGVKGPHRDAVLLNAALGLETVGMGTGREAVARAAEAIDSGAVLKVVQSLET